MQAVRFISIPGQRLGLMVIIFLLVFCGPATAGAADAVLYLDGTVPQAAFAAEEIQSAFEARGLTLQSAPMAELAESDAPLRIVLALVDSPDWAQYRVILGLPQEKAAEAFAIRQTRDGEQTTWWVIGDDTGGLMYGGLDLAEAIRIAGLEGVRATQQRPRMAMRGIKFNIPLDVRTPSYTDLCDSAQQNIAEMWNFEFWTETIDALARNRYNHIALWSLHPFPSMVKVPEYPNVALADVQRSTTEWNEYYNLTGKAFDAPEIMNNVETLKVMTIEEKIDFWRKVMQYAHDRHIDFYIITWNIFVYGTGGQYGITDSINNPITVDYFRKSVQQMFLTYPLLAGIGLTTGENMPGASNQKKEAWAFATYGQGVLDVLKEQPGRKIRFIHRQHQTGAQEIAATFAPLVENPNVDFVFSFKYAKAHALSSVSQPFANDYVKELGGLKTLWTLRNDDNYLFRWGAPDFVREFIRNIPSDPSQGFYYGSDGWVWGREFLSTEPETPRQLEVAKHWYHWMLWGRLGYDPDLDNARLTGIIQQRFPTASAGDLFQAWQSASMIYPLTTGFHWGALDFQWYIEACKSSPGPAETESGFHDVNRFISLAPHPGTDNLSIPAYVKALAAGKSPQGTTPPQVAAQLKTHAETALRLIAGIEPGDQKELRLTLGDIRAMANLGLYYSDKILGATELALYRATRKPGHQAAAVAALTRAAGAWERYTTQAASQYRNPLWTNRVGYVDWEKLTQSVQDDIRIASEPLPNP